MSNPRIASESKPVPITYRECRKHCSCCRNALKAMAIAYVKSDEFSGYDRSHLQQLYEAIPQSIKRKLSLEEEEYPFVLHCVIDWADHLLTNPNFPPALQGLVNSAYEKEYQHPMEWCLNHKSQESRRFHDYLYGCYSGDPNDPDAMRHRASHQFCIATESMANAEAILKRHLDGWLNPTPSFEELYHNFREECKRDAAGIGALGVYDSCLRIGWQQDPQILPVDLYLHAGVKWGAESIYYISTFVPTDWYTGEVNPKKFSEDEPVGLNLFLGFLSDLQPAYRALHVENEFCCFHEPLFLIETALRVKKGIPLRKDPAKIIKKAKEELQKAKHEALSTGKVLKKTRYEDYIPPQDKRYLYLLDLLGYRYEGQLTMAKNQ